jgi:hypothetical protein
MGFDACFLVFALLVAVVAVGISLWVLCAFISKALFPPDRGPLRPEPPSRRRGPLDCQRCGYKVPANVSDCPRCGLDCEGLVAAELTDLEATARQLERFRRVERLPKEALDQVWALVQARHELLVGEPQAAPAIPVPVLSLTEAAAEQPVRRNEVKPAPAEKPSTWVPVQKVSPLPAADRFEDIPTVLPAPPPWVRLRDILTNNQPETLTASDRVHIVLWYRQSPAARLDELSGLTLERLALVLNAAGLLEDALKIYRRLLTMNPGYPTFAEVALTAARLALPKHSGLAHSFLLMLVSCDLAPEQEEEVAGLSRSFKGKAEEPTLSVTAAAELPRPVVAVLPVAAAPPHSVTEGKREAAAPTVLPVAPVESLPSVEPPSRRSRWVGILAGFMEERNILWGELVGGLLIVGGSIALVVSLWNTLQENPYFPFGIFGAVTAALFGAGLYTWSHWRLQATSRGLLVIAALLVPLTFLVLPSTIERGRQDLLELGVAGAVLLLFAFCLYRAARVLALHDYWVLPLAVVGAAATQLAAGRLLTGEQPSPLVLLGLGVVPVACQCAGISWARERLRRRGDLGLAAGGGLLALLGLATFAVAVALAFLAASCAEPVRVLPTLAPLVAAAAMPVLLSGLLVHQGLEAQPDLAVLRTTGTAVALAGVALMLLALGLAWPLPYALVLVGLLNAAVLSWIAYRHAVPLAHAPALFCLAVAYLLVFHWTEDYSASPELLLAQLWSLPAALRLVCFGVATAGASEVLLRWRRSGAATWYAVAAGVAGVVSLVEATGPGLSENPTGALTVYAVAGTTALASNLRWRRRWLSYAGLVVITGAVLWGLRAWAPVHQAAWSAVLAGEALILCLAALVLHLRRWQLATMPQSITVFSPLPCTGGRGVEEMPPREVAASTVTRDDAAMLSATTAFLAPLQHCAEIVALLALPFGLLTGWWDPWQPVHVAAGVLLTTSFLLLTAQVRRLRAGTLAGVSLVGTTAVATEVLASVLQAQAPQGWISLGVALATCCLAIISLSPPLWHGKQTSGAGSPWYAILPLAWREVILASGMLALWLNVATPAAVTQFPVHAFSMAVVAVTCWLLAGQYRTAFFTWIGSTLLLVSLGLALNWTTAFSLPDLIVWTLLLHATLQLVPALILDWLCERGWLASQIRQLYALPLTRAGLLSTWLALPVLVLGRSTALLLTWQSGWLALLWLIVAVYYRRRWLLAAFQLAAVLTVLNGVAAWLAQQAWVLANPAGGWWEPRSVQAYGAGLALLCGLWIVARISLQKTETGRRLLLPDWPGVDRWLLWGLVLGQLGLVDWAILRDVLVEVLPDPIGSWSELRPELWPEIYAQGYGGGAWLIQGILGAVLLLSLWQPAPARRQTEAVLGLALLLLALPALLAGGFAGEQASASALRWSMAVALVVGSIPLWCRIPLAQLARGLGIPPNPDGRLDRRWRAVLMDGLATPVLVLTVLIAVLVMQGWTIPGPRGQSFFGRMPAPVSLFTPLGLIALALVGHALRERSAGYSFAAGLLVTACTTGGYALDVALNAPGFTDTDGVRLLQIAAITSAAWGLLWLPVRRWVRGGRTERPGFWPDLLMALQVAMPVLLNLVILLPGVLFLTVALDWEPLAATEVWYPPQVQAWTAAVGGWPGWLALVLAAAAVHGQQRCTLRPALVGLFGLALVGLAACTVEAYMAGAGWRTLLIGLGLFVMAWALLPWWRRRTVPATERTSGPFFRAALPWVYSAGALLILASLQAIFVHSDHIWGASLIAVAGLAVTLVGFERRQEGLLFLGSLVLVLAVALGLWHYHIVHPLPSLSVYLLQLAGLVLLILSAVWLRVYGDQYRHSTEQPRSSALPFQLFCGTVCVALPLLVAVVLLCRNPDQPPGLLAALANLSGWIALIAAVTTVAWFLTLFRPRYLVHVFAVGGVLLAIQVSAALAAWDDGNWLSYHALSSVSGLVGLLLCAGGWAAASGRQLGPRFLAVPIREKWTETIHILFPARVAHLWAQCFGILLTGLALHAALADPGRPGWPAVLLGMGCLLAIGLLLWTRRPTYIHILGSLIGLIGIVFWLAWGQGLVDRLLYTTILSLSVATVATGWLEQWWRRTHRTGDAEQPLAPADYLAVLSLQFFTGFVAFLVLIVADSPLLNRPLRPVHELLAWVPGLALPGALVVMVAVVVAARLHHPKAPSPEALVRLRRLSFSVPACYLGLSLFAMLALLGVSSDLGGDGLILASPLAWTAWAALVGASIWSGIGNRESGAESRSLAALPLYMVGLLGVLLELHQLRLTPFRLCWLGGVTLAEYVLLASLIVWGLTRGRPLRWFERLSWTLPPQRWFVPVQMYFSLMVVALSFWTACWWPNWTERLFGPLALLMLLPAWLVLNGGIARRSAAPRFLSDSRLRQATLMLGSLLGLCLAWALLDPAESPLPLLRSVLFLGVLGAATLLYGLGMPRWLPPSSPWRTNALSLGRGYWLLGLVVVVGVLLHEVGQYQLDPSLPHLPVWAVVLVGVAFLAFVASSIWFAVIPEHDPFALSENWRTKYVYTAEVLLALLFVHVRITAPHLFVSGNWPLVVLAIAFVGVGLSELFQRLRLPVLAIPLQRTGIFLPLLPLLAFWFQPTQSWLQVAAESAAGLPPLDAMLTQVDFNRYALYWFLAGGVYLGVALTRRSSWFTLVAVLAMNFGFWSLLYQHRDLGLGFLSHPQLWLIPLAVILLAAEHLNRDRLNAVQSLALRYLGLIILYLSSTADLFLTGLGDVRMALVLAGLSVAGVLAGIVLRVRAFLFVGFTFLMLVIGSQIWNAAVNKQQTWVWWAAVIVLGVTILALFALFEKRRQEVLKMLEELKRWK